MGISHNGWAHKPIQGWWAPSLRRQLGVNSEVEYSCHWSRAWNHLERSKSRCQVIMVTITKPRQHGFWNKTWFTIQLTLGCSRTIPRVRAAEGLSARLGPVPVPIKSHRCRHFQRAHSFANIETDLGALRRKQVLNGGWITLEHLQEVHYSQANQDFLIHGSLALFSPACLCMPVMLTLADWCGKPSW